MPVYEYECSKCGEKFEQRRNVDDPDSEVTCPRCEAKGPRRLFSQFATGAPNSGCAPSQPT
jgi:putative FmdB family regulatory protein